MLKHEITVIEQYYPLFGYAHPKNLINLVTCEGMQSELPSAMSWSKNGKIKVTSKLRLQIKENPVHTT